MIFRKSSCPLSLFYQQWIISHLKFQQLHGYHLAQLNFVSTLQVFTFNVVTLFTVLYGTLNFHHFFFCMLLRNQIIFLRILLDYFELVVHLHNYHPTSFLSLPTYSPSSTLYCTYILFLLTGQSFLIPLDIFISLLPRMLHIVYY